MISLIEKIYAYDHPVTVTATSTTTTVPQLMEKVVGWVSIIVGALAFIYLIYSGIMYITAAGNPDQAKKGQQGIINAIIGIVICVFAYSIVKIIAGTFTV